VVLYTVVALILSSLSSNNGNVLNVVQIMKQMVTFELFPVSTGYYSERQAIAEAQSQSACYFFNIKLIYSKVNLFDS
jgi:hypothetical protein